MVELNPIFYEFNEFFIKPIFEIDLKSDLKSELRENILTEIIGTKLDDAIKILRKCISSLLELEKKKDIIEYLNSRCPEDNVFHKTAVQKNLHHISQNIIKIVRGLSQKFIDSLNDLSIEYYADNFDLYSLKIYQIKGSLRKLLENTNYILEKYTGKIGAGLGSKHMGLGKEYHDLYTLQPSMSDEVNIIIYFNLNDPEFHSHNNIYINFWGIGKNRKLWIDISESTIDKISRFLREFLDEPNLQIIDLNQSTYFNKSPLPEKIVDVIESSQSLDVSLKYDRIIDIDFSFRENTYNEIRSEINGTYRKKYFTSMYVLIRKLLENLIIDCLRNFYKKRHSEKYYDKSHSRFLIFEKLKKNFNSMIQEATFKLKVGEVDQYMIDILDKFREKGNISSHSLFNLNHHKIVEENKDILNVVIKRLNEIRENL